VNFHLAFSENGSKYKEVQLEERRVLTDDGKA
jgi:hypothetical protein